MLRFCLSISHPAVEQLRPIVLLRADPSEHVRTWALKLDARDALLVRPTGLDSLDDFTFRQRADLLAADLVAPAQLHIVLRAATRAAR
jgi:hypothetical protein